MSYIWKKNIKSVLWSGIGFMSGGIIYKMSYDLYQKKFKNISYSSWISLKDTINLGGFLGGTIGLLRGYYGKPILELLKQN